MDGFITKGTSSINTVALTGESLPKEATVGDKVVSGTININGAIKVRVDSIYAESTVSKILNLVENSSSRKAKVENFITKFAHYYTPCVVFAALALSILPPLLFFGEFGLIEH